MTSETDNSFEGMLALIELGLPVPYILVEMYGADAGICEQFVEKCTELGVDPYLVLQSMCRNEETA